VKESVNKCDFCCKFRKNDDMVVVQRTCGNGFEVDQDLKCIYCVSEEIELLIEHAVHCSINGLVIDKNK